MNFEDVKIINESNAARRALTHPGRDEYLLNQKSKPAKKIIVKNEAAKKLTMSWDKYRDPTDSLREIMLDPTPRGYGGNGAYGVWEAVKGKEGMYADTSNINGKKWSFTECFLSEEGAKKLQNNVMPLPSDFERGASKSGQSWAQLRRKRALNYVAQYKQEVKKDMTDLHKYGKQLESEEDRNNRDDLYKKQDAIREKYSKVGLNMRGHVSRSSKEGNRFVQVLHNFAAITKKLDPYVGHGSSDKYSKEAWELIHKISEIETEAHLKQNNKEVANKIDKVKAEVDNFIKNHPL